jgi:hypothetical protein
MKKTKNVIIKAICLIGGAFISIAVILFTGKTVAVLVIYLVMAAGFIVLTAKYRPQKMYICSSIFILCLSALLAGFIWYDYSAENRVASIIRAFPYPYQSMLALCSDIDGTTPREFEDVHRFLNTKEQTEMGEGLGLDIADSFWMYMASDIDHIADRDGNGLDAVMTWFHGISDTAKDAAMIVHYFELGWIDSIHSWGDFSRKNEDEHLFTRSLAERAVSELRNQGIQPTVWINHGNAANTQNMEAGDIETYRQGASPGTESYHADITVPLGIKFVWLSDDDMHFGRKDILYPVTLADGQKLWGFRRYTPGWNIYDLDTQLSDAHLDACIKKGLPVVVAQHFGGTDLYKPFIELSRQALRRLAERHEHGEILITRTSRLLEYLRVRDHLVFEVADSYINILAIDDPQLGYDADPSLASLRGITFYIDDMAQSAILVNGQPIPEDLLVRAKDATGHDLLGIVWFEPYD